jgi:hypothetical protein
LVGKLDLAHGRGPGGSGSPLGFPNTAPFGIVTPFQWSWNVMKTIIGAVVIFVFFAVAPGTATSGTRTAVQTNPDLPKRVGECTQTSIVKITTRFGERLLYPVPKDFDPGTSVTFANNGSQVSYTMVPEIYRSWIGDRVLMCLISIPRDCPSSRPDDNRGLTYTTTNLRTEESWTLPDSQHRCGGA